MVNAEHYTYRVRWSAEDEEFVGTCAEFPSLSYLDSEQRSAMVGIVELVKSVIADMQKMKEAIPDALGERSFSGNFPVRGSPDLHRRLVIAAAEQGESLNAFVVETLSHHVP